MNRVGVPYLTRHQPALHIPTNAVQHASRRPVRVEPRGVEVERSGISPQVVTFERLLPVEEQLVHLPEPTLKRLSRSGRGEGVRVDVGQRKEPKGKAHRLDGPALQELDVALCLSRVGALVVAVLEDEPTWRRTADVVHAGVKRLKPVVQLPPIHPAPSDAQGLPCPSQPCMPPPRRCSVQTRAAYPPDARRISPARTGV